MANTSAPMYSANDLIETIDAIQHGFSAYDFSETQMDAIYYFVSEVTGMSVDILMEKSENDLQVRS